MRRVFGGDGRRNGWPPNTQTTTKSGKIKKDILMIIKYLKRCKFNFWEGFINKFTLTLLYYRFNQLKEGPLGVYEGVDGTTTHHELLAEVSKQMKAIFGYRVKVLASDKHPCFKVRGKYDLFSSTLVTAKLSKQLTWRGSNGAVFLEQLLKNVLTGRKITVKSFCYSIPSLILSFFQKQSFSYILLCYRTKQKK